MPVELVVLDHPAHDLNSDAFRRLGPFEQIPAIDDDGVVLSESAAILIYLAKKAGQLMGDVAAAIGAAADGGGRARRPGWLRRRAVDVAVPLLMLLLVLAGTALTVLFFYAFVWLTGTFMGWLVSLVWTAAGPGAAHGWKVVMSGWAVVAWFLFTTRDGYNRSHTRHERRWRSRDDPPAN